MTFDIQHFSLAELTLLIKIAERRLKDLTKRRPAAEVRCDLTRYVDSQGYAIEELLSRPAQYRATKKRTKRKLPKVAPKYRDPDNPRNTWSGRGSQPRWLAEKVNRGHQATDFLIPGMARPTAKRQSQVGRRTVYKTGEV